MAPRTACCPSQPISETPFDDKQLTFRSLRHTVLRMATLRLQHLLEVALVLYALHLLLPLGEELLPLDLRHLHESVHGVPGCAGAQRQHLTPTRGTMQTDTRTSACRPRSHTCPQAGTDSFLPRLRSPFGQRQTLLRAPCALFRAASRVAIDTAVRSLCSPSLDGPLGLTLSALLLCRACQLEELIGNVTFRVRHCGIVVDGRRDGCGCPGCIREKS